MERIGQIRIRIAGHTGGLHRPVQKLGDTLISFPDPPRGKRNANEYCPAAPKKQSPRRGWLFFALRADSNVYRKPRWGFRRPVQTLVCSSVSFRAAREKKCKRILPSSSGAHPAQGCAVVRSGLLIDTIPLSFACPKERGKENDTQEGKISFSPPPENLPH